MSRQLCLSWQRLLRPTTRLYEVVQPRPPDYGYTESLPLGSGCLESPRIDTPEGSPPAEIKISRSPDRLQTEISATSTEMAGGSHPAYVDICVIPDVLPITKSVKAVMSDKSMMMDTPDGVITRMEIAGGSPPAEIRISKSPDRLQMEISVTSTEMAGGSPPADIDICKSPEVLQRAGFVTAVVSEKWMERFVINPKVICLDGLAPDDGPARRGSDVGSDVCVIQNQIPTVVSVRNVVTEKWMDRFVLDLVECPSVSRTSAVARTFGPAVSEEYSPFCWGGGGGGGCRCIPPGCRRVGHSSGVWPTVGRVRYSSGVCPACCRL